VNNSRTCSHCGVEYPFTVEHFVPNKECSGGLAGTCRTCWRAYQRAYKVANRDRLAARRRALYLDHNADIQKARHLQRLHDRPLHMRAAIMRQGMIDRSKKRNIPFDTATLTVRYLMDWIERTPACPCCGAAIDYGYKNGKPTDLSPSIDRFDPPKGYILGNVVLICWRCNNLKRNATPDELEGIARWMRTHTAGSH
jgi:hypothetical protein